MPDHAHTPDVRLRPVEITDIPALHANEADPAAAALAGVKPRSAEAYERHWRQVLADEAVIPRAILADGALAGVISRFHTEGLDMVGYWIAREHWGRGIATRAVGLFLQEVSARPLYARVAIHNTASLRILERHGFVVTDTRHEPETDRYAAGEVVSLVLR